MGTKISSNWYLANTGHTRIDVLATVDVFDGTFTKEKVYKISNVE